MFIGFLVCVCGGTEIAGILVCSTFDEALGQELSVKIHQKVWWKLKILYPQFFFHSSKCIRPILPNMKSQLPLRAENKRENMWIRFFSTSKTTLNTFGQCPHRISSYGCRRIWDFPKFSEMCPTLRSCISELKEYFFMGPVPLQRSMSKLSNEPNTNKNGHLVPKLQSIQNRKFPKNRFHTPRHSSRTSRRMKWSIISAAVRLVCEQV